MSPKYLGQAGSLETDGRVDVTILSLKFCKAGQ